IWALPSPSHTTYAPYDDSSARGELVGHIDAIWDLALVRDEEKEKCSNSHICLILSSW
ncbi:hypothetical protein P692DRAFT_201730728, partial [Suillus brevipes Sb2]